MESADGGKRDRLERQADRLAALAETGADHGRLAGHENTLREVKTKANDDVAVRIDAITAYREPIEGV